jgi:hypothetical protein
MNYLRNNLLLSWKTRIIKCFINKMLLFDNIITSRVEKEHFKLKRALRTSIDDLKKMINVIKLVLKNEKFEYRIEHEEVKNKLSRSYSILIMKNLHVFISSYALRLIRKQIDQLTKARNFLDSISSCIKIE